MGSAAKMKILITGGAGYIGYWSTRKFLEAGNDVVVVDKLLFPSGVEALASLGVTPIEADIRTYDFSKHKDVDVVLHLAGLSNDPSSAWNPEANHQMNTVGTQRLVDGIGDKHIIFASSASVYGFSDKPKLTEEDPTNPISYYAESKLAAEEFVLQANGVVLRQATVMGFSPRHRNDLVVSAMLRSACLTGKILVNAGGEAMRPLVEIQDLAECHVRMAESDAIGIFNVNHNRIGSTRTCEGYTVACLAMWIKELLHHRGVQCEVVGNWDVQEGRSYDTSSEKLRKTLGWQPERGVAAAINDILEGTQGKFDAYDRVNIEWLKALEYGQKITQKTGGVFEI